MTTTLIPADPKQCQAEKPNGNTFMTLGGRPGLVRCDNKPTWIMTEDKPGRDGLQGSMSICLDCRTAYDEYVKQGKAPKATFTIIKRRKAHVR